ncbi:alpha-galactosidase [Puerhibacterium puerhi]|uniref:alpha-galactosidase n=1 Tax=Puerhibacterium puerhi TaxID=2692623 RepID=UPI00135B0C77|nr:alpha-galactosidase [Puerhibacterium puerhi]
MGLAPRGAGLVSLGWRGAGGAGDDGVPAGVPAAPASPFETDLDRLPLEATALGTRSVHGVELVVRRADGVRGARLAVRGEVALEVTDEGAHLACPLADDVVGLGVTLHLRTSRQHDVVEKWADVRNDGGQPVELLRAWGGAFNLPVGPGAVVRLLTGAWSRELAAVDTDLAAGTLSIGSRQGITSHTYAPLVGVRRRPRGGDGAVPGVPPADHPAARFGVALAWSGSWRLAVDAVPAAPHVRVSAGLDDESGVHTLGPGQVLTTPALLGTRVEGTADDLAHAWHGYQRTLARSTGPEHRPVVYNSWYATGFDVRAEHQLALADVAGDVGAEVFVVDDGWFRGRTSDAAGLGDWEADPARLPRGLGQIADGVRARGMRFGLWIEPEGVSPDSDLYRAHPDWVHRVAGRAPTTQRRQLVLDLGRPDVEEWVLGTLRRLLGPGDVSYLKWDMNRSVTDGGQPGAGGDDWSWRHTTAYYRVLEALRAEFPHVTVEACAGGGGRVDAAVLARTDVVWPSDETGPRDRLAIQHGFLEAYPPWVMSSWVTDMPDRVDTEPSSLAFRFVVAMSGVLGIGADLLRWDEATRATARDLVRLYTSLRDVVHHGRVRRHGTPADAASAVQYTTPGSVVVLAWRRAAGGQGYRVRLQDLDPAARYRVRGTPVVHEGGALATDGLPVGWRWGDCDVVVLDREP